MTVSLDAGARFVDAIVSLDPAAIGAAVAPHARMRALVPPGVREDEGADAIAARFALWLDDKVGAVLVESELEPVADRTRFRYRIGWTDADGARFMFDQAGYLVVENGEVVAVDLVCSGDRPVAGDGA